MRGTIRVLTAAGAAFVVSQASADAMVTFGFTDLAGTFTGAAGNGNFSSVDDSDSSGDVSRLEPVSGTADYDAGFSGLSDAAVSVDISVFGRVGNLAFGAGNFAITDADGDVLMGDITGFWVQGLLGIFFNGDLSNVVFDSTNGDGSFDGPDGGSFSTTLPGTPPYEGALVQLFVPPAPNFFEDSFFVESVQVDGEIIPSPGAIALLGIAAAAGVRRRRRRN